jgi:hypothetical protein
MKIGVITKDAHGFANWCKRYPLLAPYAVRISQPEHYQGMEFSEISVDEAPDWLTPDREEQIRAQIRARGKA